MTLISFLKPSLKSSTVDWAVAFQEELHELHFGRFPTKSESEWWKNQRADWKESRWRLYEFY